ncbi:cytochrome-c peroxidase, partial [Mesorhizobium sp. M8A.F.Ca.ET.021.01.1.1]
MTRRRWKIRAIAIAAISTFGLAAPANSAGPDGFHPGPLSRAEA